MRGDALDEELERYWELLGVRPRASAQELKEAYRDLAKVWHPDRFAHDPRLQRKAQEQLKEINEAYRRLVSGDCKTATRARRDERDAHEQRATYAPPRAARTDSARDRSQHESPHEASAAVADVRVATRSRRGVKRIA